MKLVCISDTHGFHRRLEIPPCDVLIHAGDIARGRGSLKELVDFNEWLVSIPAKHKLVIPGNHDVSFQQAELACRDILQATVLIDQSIVVDDVSFYGSPWQPWFYDWAFNVERGPKIAAKWAKIPQTTNVLITHGPPRGILDQPDADTSVGCDDLLARIQQMPALKAHVFGHIHESTGVAKIYETTFINASICNRSYSPVNPPRILEL